MMAARCFCGLDSGRRAWPDRRNWRYWNGLVTMRVLKQEEGRGVSLTWRGGDSIMVRHERTRRRR
jgi:hypothetical protein